MSLALIGKKIGMTQVFDAAGKLVPVSVIELGPCPVVQKKNTDRDGYNALQLGFGVTREKLITKAEVGHIKKALGKDGATPTLPRVLKEFRDYDVAANEGDTLTVAVFEAVKKVKVSGVSKGKGFAGVLKRLGYHGGPASHGSMHHRKVGSMGANTTPGRVWKNKGLPGHHGARKKTVINLSVHSIDTEKNLMLVHGAIPGVVNSIVFVEKLK